MQQSQSVPSLFKRQLRQVTDCEIPFENEEQFNSIVLRTNRDFRFREEAGFVRANECSPGKIHGGDIVIVVDELNAASCGENG